MLWTEIANRVGGSPLQNESRYVYLNRSGRPEAERIRSWQDAWLSRYPEANRTALVSAYRSRRDSQYVGAAFELYLHELLLRLGDSVEVDPDNPTDKNTRPDFKVTTPDGGDPVFVEATLSMELSKEEQAAEARTNEVFDAINKLERSDFWLALHTQGEPDTQPPGAWWRREVAKWLSTLDPDVIAAEIAESVRRKRTFTHEGWTLTVTPYPKSPEQRGTPGVGPIVSRNYGARFGGLEGLGEAVTSKGQHYGELPHPLVVAVNVVPRFPKQAHHDDVLQALLGANGAWHQKQPRYTRVSAALVVWDFDPWTPATADVRLYHHPWASIKYQGALCRLPQSRARLAPGMLLPKPDGSDLAMDRIDGENPRDILGLPEGWPSI